MKKTLNIPILLSMALGMASGMANASQSFATDDLALVFYAKGATSIGSEYYVFNLGPASGFRDNTQNNVAVKAVNNSIANSNIATDLASVFGQTWFDDGTVHMMVVSAIPGSANPPTNGDPTKTIYYSIARTSLNTADKGADPNTVFPTLGSTVRTQCAASLTTFFTGTNGGITDGATSGANTSGVRLTTSSPNNLSTLIPPAKQTYFTVGADPTATLGNGTTGSGVLQGTAGVVAAVDVCRILNTTPTGTTLTSGSSTGNAVIGTPQFIGSITLDHSGNLKVQAAGVASGYTSWATSNAGSQTPSMDFNNDGVQNGIAYFMNATGRSTNPGLNASNKVTWPNGGNIASSAYGTQFVVQTSTDLATWTAVSSSDPNLSNLTGSVSYTLPTGSPKKFCRLVVTP